MATPRASTPSPAAGTTCSCCEGDFGVDAKGRCNLCGYNAHKKKRRVGTPSTASRERKRHKTTCKKSCSNGQIPLFTTPEPLSERLAVQDEIGIFLEEQGTSIFQEGHDRPEIYLTANALLGGDDQDGHAMSADILFFPIPFENDMLSPPDIDIGHGVDAFFSSNPF